MTTAAHMQLRAETTERLEALSHLVGSHRIHGISDDLVPAIMDLSAVEGILGISDGDSTLTAQRLARELGIGVGISSGCNFLAAVKVQSQLGSRAVVSAVFCDDNNKYLSTTLFEDEPVREHYRCTRIRLRSMRSFRRASQLCSPETWSAQ